jgi:hypothetical protein
VDIQYVILGVVILGAIVYAVSRVRRTLRQEESCCGCEGCQLCEEKKKECCAKKKDCQKFGQSK